MMLLTDGGLTAEATAIGKSLLTVRRRHHRYVAKGMDGLLKDAERPSRVESLPPEKNKHVTHMTLHEKPQNPKHWRVRCMVMAAGPSNSSVHRIWHGHGLKPYLVDTFKISRHAAKVEGTVGR